jgi:hypothetical protein
MNDHWHDVVTHKDVEPFVLRGLASYDDFKAWLMTDGVTEYRYPGGGFVFVDKPDGVEIHVAFLPDFWGRSLAMSFRDVFQKVMAGGRNIIAHEWADNWRSMPPRSYGFVEDGVFENTEFGVACKRWVLTPETWYRSPVGRKCNGLYR